MRSLPHIPCVLPLYGIFDDFSCISAVILHAIWSTVGVDADVIPAAAKHHDLRS